MAPLLQKLRFGAARNASRKALHAVEMRGVQTQPGQPPSAHAHRRQVRAAHMLHNTASVSAASRLTGSSVS